MEGRGVPSRSLDTGTPPPAKHTVIIQSPPAMERQYRSYPFVESWSRTPGFKSFAIRPSSERGFTWTWKAQIPDGRHVYLHGFVDSYQEAMLACDYALEREDWRTDKYA